MAFEELIALTGRVQTLQLLAASASETRGCRIYTQRTNLSVLFKELNALGLNSVCGFDAIAEDSAPWLHFAAQRSFAGPHAVSGCYVYAAMNRSLAERLRQLDESGRNDEMAELSGIPHCCASGKKSTQLSEMILDRYPAGWPIAWVMNVALMEYDLSLLPYVPCGPECSLSRDYAYENFELLRASSLELSDQLFSLLTCDVLCTRSLGIVSLEARAVADHFVVRRCLVSGSAPLSSLLELGSTIMIDEEGVAIDRVYLPAVHCRFYRFR